MSWYRLYRPRTVSGLHLANVRQTLEKFMDQGQIPQVMLFAGPKGTGKTSSARIIGAILNDPHNAAVVDHQFFGQSAPSKKNKHYLEPEVDSEFNRAIYLGQSYVVQELDAASNRGIDDVRQLKERVALPPQQGKMTVYILDEAHMLTTEAFNALLKLLEEPPPHAVFILATTELHKIPATIKSRCSIIHFRQASADEIKAALQVVIDQEKLKAEEEALDLIAYRADGSFRDAIKMLEMTIINGRLTMDGVEQVLVGSVDDDIKTLLTSLLDKDRQQAIALFEDLRSRQVDEQFFLSSVLNFLHRDLLKNLEVVDDQAFASYQVDKFLLINLNQIEPHPHSPLPHLSLELVVLDLIDRANQKNGGSSSSSSSNSSSNSASQTSSVTKSTPQSTQTQSHRASSKKTSKISDADRSPHADSPLTAATADQVTLTETGVKTVVSHLDKGDSQQLLARWSELLSAVKSKNMTLEALLRSAKPVRGVNGTATIAVYYKFHKEQLEQPKFRAVIDECVHPLAGGRVKLEYVLQEAPGDAELAEPPVKNDPQSLPQNLAVMAEEVLV